MHVHGTSICNGLLERLGSPLALDSEALVDADTYDEARGGRSKTGCLA